MSIIESIDSTESASLDAAKRAPLAPYDGLLKIVYSNRPDLVIRTPKRFFRGEIPWFPENMLRGLPIEDVHQRMVRNNWGVFTNSPFFLQTVQASVHKDLFEKVILFVHIHFHDEAANIMRYPYLPYTMIMSTALDALPSIKLA